MLRFSRVASILQIAILLLVVGAQANEVAKNPLNPGGLPGSNSPRGAIAADLVSVVLSKQAVKFENAIPISGPALPQQNDLKFQDRVGLTASSMLPEWGVCLKALPLTGAAGTLPPGRVWAKTEATQGEFCPLDQGVAVIVGDFRAPVRETSFDLGVRPDWTDHPGIYQGTIMVTPFLPQVRRGSGATLEGNNFLGESQPISIQFEIPEMLLISTQGADFHFNTDVGPGIYAADKDVTFRVTTNASKWRVYCKAEPLTGGDTSIPASRIQWERIDGSGQRIAAGNLGEDYTVASGSGPALDYGVRVRFKVEVRPDDIASQYNGKISFVGVTGP